MFKWEDGTKVSDAYVDENGTIHPAIYEGNTPLTAHNLNMMQTELIDNINSIDILIEELISKIDMLEKGQTYSTDEVVIGKWRDGTKIYRKVFIDTTNSNSYSIAHNIEGFTTLIALKGSVRTSAQRLPWGFVNLDANAFCSAFANDQYINVRISASYAESTKIIILEYLKNEN